ncbi:hypothetical protein SYNTR_2273 [Candidatus Syntrophocurvum alkaliphilum]|uniref:Putative regulatory protein FmdB zinc ribbon domain-containing protein n=1 Tax=Candidatus Syntrophocurvum alkaliphilum TaxID=2293317 RepID=A0A6I6DMB3_9FIRM|nr:zinc ribbon domain-containing protein [Candidatus Syntrophocurvum alkaliphilum]QGU00867.1 hypothetical protein SYNTR_2273 [Candidatus Syntrophocurvum alkaliphilum]
MPIYDYKCEKCGNFEKQQRITEEALKECPNCNSKVERIISKNVGVVFKGQGFYKTDTSLIKDKMRSLNKERQTDNQAILDGDVAGFNKQSEKTEKKVLES